MDCCIYDRFSPCDHDCSDCPQEKFDRFFCKYCQCEIPEENQKNADESCIDCFVADKLKDFQTLKEFAQDQILEFQDFLIIKHGL